MLTENVNISVPLQSLIDSITKLDLRDKIRLFRLLDDEIANLEENLFENDPVIRAEIHEARAAYKAGDYKTIDEFINEQHK
ncbi:MAG: hypothetical protein HY964_07420 [Ignavibacteriales bacterium]|nr:hypothetical protein [Ignavibacteriales bacterium]